MPTIILKTSVFAPKEVCFDLSRSIDLHTISTKHTGEQAVSGVVAGLIENGETITWRAKHFGIWQHLASKITEYERPNYFVDEMQKGAFRRFCHKHVFEQAGESTLMTDIFDYTSPLGVLGRLADKLFLEAYMRRLLTERNRVIKTYAENGQYIEVFKIGRDVKSTCAAPVT